MMRICVIFNPSAKGEKARRFRRHLEQIAAQAALKLTACPGDARRLAKEAVLEGFERIVAAGGDGTVNEVLNGLGDAPEGFERSSLGVLPLGTVNVFARELVLPKKLGAAWDTILHGSETRIDLPWVEYANNGAKERRYFAQLAGAGLDARAVELVNWELKRKLGPVAYVIAGLQALLGPPARITVTAGAKQTTGGLVLIGNGRLYGGDFRVFPGADLRDGLLEICVFPRVNWVTLAQCGPPLLFRGCLPASAVQVWQAESFQLTGENNVPMELDGEFVGRLPATFGIQRSALRVVAPSPAS